MRPRWRPELLLVSLLLAAGCGLRQAPADVISKGEWIEMLTDAAGIVPDPEEKPYIAGMAADDAYFSSVQCAAAFGVLDEDDAFDTKELLDRDWAAYTLVRLVGSDPVSEEVADADRCVHPDEAAAAAELGILTCRSDGSFDPQDLMTRDEAQKALARAIDLLNHPDLPERNEITVRDDAEIRQIEKPAFDASSGIASFAEACSLQEGDLVTWAESDGTVRVMETVRVIDERHAELLEADPLSYTESMDLSGEADLDFSKAEVIGEGQQSGAVHASARPVGSLNIAGYEIDYTLSSSGVSAEVSRTMPHGEELYASLKLNGIHVKYSWKSARDNVKGAYFTVSCHAQEDFGVRIENYRKLYGDFSALKPDDFLNSLRNVLTSASAEPVEIPICTLRIPLEGTHTLSIRAQLLLKIAAGGRLQLTLSQDLLAGMEKREGAMRLIHENEHEENASVRADFSVTGIVKFAFDFFRKSLMDAGIEAGAQCTGTTSLHLYGEDGKKNTVQVPVSYDAADEMAEGNPDVLVCTDLNAYWVLRIRLNSDDSVLSRFGMKRTFSLPGSGSSIFEKGRVHLENFRVTDSCTRKDRKQVMKVQETVTTDRILIDAYARAVHIGEPEKIRVRGIPSGYTEKEIVYVSADPSVASVSADGLVTAHASGSTEVTVQTADGKFSAVCSILVPVETEA